MRILFVLLLVAGEAWSTAVPDAPLTYRATYRVEYRGRESGTAEISVRRHSPEPRYEFTSVMKMSGAAKILVPDAATERSTFMYESGSIIPMEFSYEDGRNGDANLQTVFDWHRSLAVTTTRTGATELTIPAGTLDRASVQVALMGALSAGGEPAGTYQLHLGDRLQTYEFDIAETAVVATGLGPLSAQRVVQRRQGTSRTLVLWMAPSLSFLPVRIEHQKNGETELSLILDGFAREGAAPSGLTERQPEHQPAVRQGL